MFSVGDYIICGKNGVCRVEEIGTMDLAGADSDRLYYTLAPVYCSGSRIFTPVDNSKMVIRAVMTKEEAQKLVGEIPQIEELWVADDKRREQAYKEAIMTCDGRALVQIIKTLYMRKKKCLDNGKKVHNIDERYLRMAEDYLYGELACALDIERGNVASYITDEVEKKTESMNEI